MSLFGCSSTRCRGSVARKVGNTAFAVKWSDKEENEANVQYVQRGLLRKPALGLVVGRRQLGERLDQANGVVIRLEASQHSSRVDPRHCGGEPECFRMTRKNKVTWFLRAACREDVKALPVIEDNQQRHYFALPPTPSKRGPAKRAAAS